MPCFSVFIVYSYTGPHLWTPLVTLYSAQGLSPGCHYAGVRTQVGAESQHGVPVGVLEKEELWFLSQNLLSSFCPSGGQTYR